MENEENASPQTTRDLGVESAQSVIGAYAEQQRQADQENSVLPAPNISTPDIDNAIDGEPIRKSK